MRKVVRQRREVPSGSDALEPTKPPADRSKPVRQPQTVAPGIDAPKATKRPADRSKPVRAFLNDRWRVIDDGLQWVLQKRTGRPTPKSTGWRGRSYLRTRASLLDSVKRWCGELSPILGDGLRDQAAAV